MPFWGGGGYIAIVVSSKELREDAFFELREDNSIEIRE